MEQTKERQVLAEIAAQLTPEHLLMVIQFANAIRHIEREKAPATPPAAPGDREGGATA